MFVNDNATWNTTKKVVAVNARDLLVFPKLNTSAVVLSGEHGVIPANLVQIKDLTNTWPFVVKSLENISIP